MTRVAVVLASVIAACSEEHISPRENSTRGPLAEDVLTASSAEKRWFRDCDADGYSAGQRGSVTAVARPAPVAGCAFTARTPAQRNAVDCDDHDVGRHPGAVASLPFSATGALPPPGDAAYDRDCDGEISVEQMSWSAGIDAAGASEFVALCEADSACSAGDSPCLKQVYFAGEPRCGVRYGSAESFGCGHFPGYYYLCR